MSDFSHVTHVINYDFPASVQAYAHRTGRTGRMGRKGVALTFFTKGNLYDLKTIIDDNRLEPVWLGQEPDLKARARGSNRSHHGRQSYRRGGKRPKRSR